MLLQEERAFMANWPLNQRLSREALEQVRKRLRGMGFKLWDSGQMYISRPFSSGSISCELEGWAKCLVIRFPLDPYPPAYIAWESFEKAQTREQIVQEVINNSHPLRFSPYCLSGPGQLFVGREAELSVLLSGLPGLLICGASGTGKSSLLLRGAEENGGGFINCQGFGYRELELRLTGLAKTGNMSKLLCLDELDYLLLEQRTLSLFEKLNQKGIAWRATLHEKVQGLGPFLELKAPKGIKEALKPLETISGANLPDNLKQEILERARGNIGKLHKICHCLLLQMGSKVQQVTPGLLEEALIRWESEGSRVDGKRAV